MLKTRLGLFLLFTAPMSIAGNKWNVTLPGGQMRFQRELIAEAKRVTGN